MKKNLCCLLLLALLGGPVSEVIAQSASRLAPTAAELTKNIAAAAASTEGQSTDKLLVKLDRQLVAYLKTHEVSAAAAKKLGLGYAESPDAARLKVFSYSYSSGGTRGEVTQPIVQWKNQAGQLFAYAAHDEGGFEKIYKLASPGRTQYLLLGNEQGSSICMRGIAWLLELKGDYLLLDKQAFDNKPTLDICNVALTYRASQQALVVAADNDIGDPDVYGEEPFKPFTLYLSQGRFVRKR